MRKERPETEPGLLATVDIRAFVETLRVRWWVFPAVLAVTVGFLFAQQSRLRTEPLSYRVSAVYDVPNPITLIGTIGINPALVVQIPDERTQLQQLAGSEIRAQITEELGSSVNMEIPGSYEDPFIITCESSDQETCTRAVDLYAERASEIRNFAIVSTLTSLRAIFQGASEATSDPIASSKVAGIDGLLNNLKTDLVKTDSYIQTIGATVGDIQDVNYRFGLVVALIVSLLILLQLTYTDSRVRSVRQLVRIVGDDAYIGVATKAGDAVNNRRTAVALYQGLRSVSAQRVVYVPLRATLEDAATISNLSALAGATSVTSKPFSELTVSEIAQDVPGEVSVIVVRRNHDLRNDVLEALAGFRQSGRRLVGFLLLD
jgi:hypothetical protein